MTELVKSRANKGSQVMGSIGFIRQTRRFAILPFVAAALVVAGGVAPAQAANPPTVSPVSVSELAEESATLKGSVNPEGFATTYQFACIPAANETATPMTEFSTAKTSAGSGIKAVGVEAKLNLEPDTTIRCSLKATNVAGTKSSAEKSLSTPTETVPAPFSPANLGLHVFGRVFENLGSFERASNGIWSFRNLSEFGEPKIDGKVVPVEVNSGESIVFTTVNHELYGFLHGRQGAPSEWIAYNVSAHTPGSPKIYGTPSVIEPNPGELFVFGRNQSNELISFIRSSAGFWTAVNVTASTLGTPRIKGSPVAVQPHPGELLVFARNLNNELVSFIRSSGGTWSLYNESAQVGGSPRLYSAPVVAEPNPGEFLVFGRTTQNELVTFIRSSIGAWSIYNVSAAAGASAMKLRGDPSLIEPNPGEFLAFSRTYQNELVTFIRSKIGAWSVYNVSEHTAGTPHIKASPAAIQEIPGELLVFARSSEDDLITFIRSPVGAWSPFNLSAQLNPKVK
jgi:hypothetical protein